MLSKNDYGAAFVNSNSHMVGRKNAVTKTWLQWTCDGCGETNTSTEPNETRTQARAGLKKNGWKHFAGDLDYCPKCVKRGIAARRETEMNA